MFHELNEEKIRKYHEKNRDVSFLIPVINGEIWLGQRGTEPKKGMYGAIGGKTDAYRGLECPFNYHSKIIKMGGAEVSSVVDKFANSIGQETPGETAMREFCEEVFSAKVLYPGETLDDKFEERGLIYPNDFNVDDIIDLKKLGSFDDKSSNSEVKINHCMVYLARVNRTDFLLSPRELTDFKPISQIDPEQIWLGTKTALIHLRYLLDPKIAGYWSKMGDFLGDENLPNAEREDFRICDSYAKDKLHEQFASLKLERFRNTSMVGTIMHYFNKGILPNALVKGINYDN